MRWILLLCLLAAPATADPVQSVAAAAAAAFDRMPPVVRVPVIAGRCGADDQVNAKAAYCTTTNTIFLANAAADRPEAPYLVAHLYGHAVQVQHGIADIALRQIRSRRSEEAKLRGDVARQVDCVAGVLIAEAGFPTTTLADWFDGDPFGGSHWGRSPLSIGPQVSIGLVERNKWFQVGQGRGLAACAPGEFTAELLLEAYKARR